ncbi:MAG: hypothetical protein PVH88_18935 [Ignavibacteria bacterium]|jgi:DNA polymerase-3 subunit delta'
MVLYRDEIYGQENVLETLSKIKESNKIPHAFLFSGIVGVGKFHTAIEFSKLINSNGNNELSEKLDHKISKLSEPYLKFIMPLPRGKGETNSDSPLDKLSPEIISGISDQISKKSLNPFHPLYVERAFNIKISSIREIKKFVSFNYDDINYRIILIYDAHLMNTESQNALLKNLEEPPEGFIFILLTSNKENLLQTILSRCWQINFSPLKFSYVKKILITKFEIPENEAQKLSIFSGGSVANALELRDSDFNDLLDQTIEILRYSLAGRFNTALNQMKDLTQSNSMREIKLFFSLITNWFNDANKLRFSSGTDDEFDEEYLETLNKFNIRFSQVSIYNVISVLNKLHSSIDKNVNLNIITLNVILELSTLIKR